MKNGDVKTNEICIYYIQFKSIPQLNGNIPFHFGVDKQILYN